MSKKSIIFAISSLILLQIAIVFIQYSEKNRSSEMQIVDYFQKSIIQKAELSKRLINDRSAKSIDLLNKEDITVLEYKNDSIVYWSNNSVCISSNTKEIISTKSFARIGNAWYLINAKGSSFALCLVIHLSFLFVLLLVCPSLLSELSCAAITETSTCTFSCSLWSQRSCSHFSMTSFWQSPTWTFSVLTTNGKDLS